MTNSKGNYIAFLDDDDFWHKNYLYDAYRNIIKMKIDIIICNTLNFFNKKKIQNNNKIPTLFKN